MKWFTILLVCILMLHAPARLGAISVVVPDDPQCDPLTLKSQIIDVRIDGPIARTTVKQVFHNPYPRDLEGVFLMPLPKSAQVTDFTMVINGKTVHAESLPKDEARRVYTDIVRRMKDPGLLEYVDEQTFRVRVFPIPANGDMPVELSFAQPLRREGELMSFELAGSRGRRTTPIGETDLNVEVNWSGKLGPVYSPTHEVTIDRTIDGKGAKVRSANFKPNDDRPFTLLLGSEGESVNVFFVPYRAPGEKEGTFLLMIHPPAEGDLATRVAKSVTFVLDISGSMNENGKIDQAKKALEQCIGMLGPEDQFNIITFSTGVDSLWESPVAANDANRERAREHVKSIVASGGTNIYRALQRALSTKVEGLHQIVFMTDGLPTVEVTSSNQILRAAKDWNTAGNRVFSFGVGYDVDARLLDDLAGQTRAVSRYVLPEEDIEVKVSGLFDTVSYPVLTNLSMKIDGVDTFDVFPNTAELPDLFRGQDLMVFGRWRGEGKAVVRLDGRLPSGDWNAETDVEFIDSDASGASYIAPLWANRKVGYLLESIRKNGENKELVDEVVALGTRYNLVTPYTSYLVMDDVEMRGVPPPDLAFLANPAGHPIDMMTNGAPPAMPAGEGYGDMNREAGGGQARLRSSSSMSTANATATSGRDGVEAARAIGEKKQSQSLSFQLKDDDLSVAASKNVAGRVMLAMPDGGWMERDVKVEDLKEVRVQYLSEAYMELLDRRPDLRAALILGEKVTLRIGTCFVIIGPDGIAASKELPAEILNANVK